MKINKLHLFIIWAMIALVISGCVESSKNDYTPEEIIKTYKINEQNPPAELLSEKDARTFFENFYKG